MTGDVLPCFDASAVILSEDSSCMITVPITLDIASNHGVIVASEIGTSDGTRAVSLVDNLLQKPSADELVKHKAILDDDDLAFLHFGTSSEILDHLSGAPSGLVGSRHLCSIPATTVSDIDASAVILSSKISPIVSIGEDSLINDISILSGVQIGSLSVVVGVSMPLIDVATSEVSFRFMLPDRHCLWEVPLVGFSVRVIVHCGVHDNPKNSIGSDGIFCGKPWEKVLSDLGLQESDMWGSSVDTNSKCLWNAKIYPIGGYSEMLSMASWLLGLNGNDESLLVLRRNSPRVSLEELHRSIDFPQMCLGSWNHQADIAAEIVKACLNFGLLGRNLSQLCEEVLQKEASGVEICKGFLAVSGYSGTDC